MKNLRTFALCLLTFALLGCATWEGLSPGSQSALKAAAKLALSFGLSQLTERVHELRPWQDSLKAILETTFAKALPPEAIGAELKRRVRAEVPAALQAAVLAEFKRALTDPDPASGPKPSKDFNRRLAAAL